MSSKLYKTHCFMAMLVTLVLLAGCVPVTLVPISDPGDGLPVMNDLVRDIEVAGEPGLYTTPLDATLDSAGETIYFTALGDQGSGLFSVPAAGGDELIIAAGDPFVLPQGLDMGSNDAALYVADAEAGGAGQLFIVTLADGTVTPLAGTEGTAPRGVETFTEGDADVVYFSGIDPADGQPAVMKIGASGGELMIVAKGAPLVDPVGMALTQDGTLYVVDRAAAGDGLGSVFRIQDGAATTIADRVRTGQFPGTALTLDDSALLVSVLALHQDSAQVLVTVLGSGDQVIVNKVIAANQGAGGLHRAQNQNIFAWADSTNGPRGGHVYRVRLP